MRLSFGIQGVPYGKARHRTTRTGIVYTPKETVQYENLVKMVFAQQHGSWKITLLPIIMHITAIFPIPKSISKKRREAMVGGIIRPTKRPDVDNIFKIIADSLNKIAYNDDSQVVEAVIRKFYGDIPEVNVTMETIK